MERPKGLNKSQLEYVEYLEGKIKDFSTESTKVNSYFAIKMTVDELNAIRS